MALFEKLFKPQAQAPSPKPAPVQVAPVPAQLPKITASKAAQIAQHSDPSPAAKALLSPQQTPSQYLSALQEKHLGGDMVKTMAHGLPDREGVHWAAQSAEKVSDKLPAADVHSMKAAQAWVKSPTPENKAAAAAAAEKSGLRGPGGLAAQGAAWSQPATPTAAPAGTAAAPRLTPHAVSASVMLSSAIKANPALAAPAAKVPTTPALQTPQPAVTPPAAPPTVPPAVQAHMFQQQHPFIQTGLDIASGKNTCG